LGSLEDPGSPGILTDQVSSLVPHTRENRILRLVAQFFSALRTLRSLRNSQGASELQNHFGPHAFIGENLHQHRVRHAAINK